ncbi:MAG: hypothetical protein RJB39_68 [Candidatus Parcubacteria bacterium]|jgi:L-amino acid N-acyltransferase YncA
MIIRPAQQQDAPGIAKVHVETWQSHYRGHMPDDFLDVLSVDDRAAFWTNSLAKSSEDCRTYVAEEDGKIIGFCSVGPMRGDDAIEEVGELYAIYAHPEDQGKGAGKDLMKTGLHFLKEKGYKKTILWVLKGNTKTRDFYESRGWMCDGIEKVIPRNGFAFEEIRYSIELPTE